MYLGIFVKLHVHSVYDSYCTWSGFHTSLVALGSQNRVGEEEEVGESLVSTASGSGCITTHEDKI